MPSAPRAPGVSAVAQWWRQLVDEADHVLTPQSLETLYVRALPVIKEALGADSVAILLADEAQHALVSRRSIGLGQDGGPVELEIRAHEGMAGRVLASQESLIVDDLHAITLVSPTLREHGLRSVVAVPIVSHSGLLGVLHAGSYELARFTAADAEILEFLADRLALALDRVRLFDEHRRLADISSFLASTARIMAEAPDFIEALDRLADAALPALGDICLIDILEDGVLERVVARHHDPTRQALVDQLKTRFPPDMAGDHPAVQVIRSGRSEWAAEMSDAFLESTTRGDEHRALTAALGFRSYLTVPIAAGGRVLGSLTTVSCGRRLQAEDVAFAECLAQQVGAVARNAHDLDLSVRTSHVLQMSLLPERLPDVPGMAVHSRYDAVSTSLEVGGDFYDLMLLDDGQVWFTIGDVEGHDRVAAAVMGQLRSAARTLALSGRSPSQLVADLRAAWSALGFDRMATAIFGQMDPASGKATLVSAGHLPPLLVSGGEATYLPVRPGPPLGVGAEDGEEWALEMARGDLLFLYTDGAINDRALGIDEGMAQLAKTVASGDADPMDICSRVVGTRAGGDDDIAMLVLKRSRHA